MAEEKDIGQELYKKVRADFNKSYRKSKKVGSLLKKLEKGNVNYEDANNFAIEVGELLRDSYAKYISPDALPDGKMYWNMCESILKPTLGNNYKIISTYSSKVQESLNNKANIGLDALKPKVNVSRIEGIMNKVANAEKFEDVEWVLGEPIVNFSQAVVDDTLKVNVDFHYRSGMQPIVKRFATGGCCKFCQSIEGTYRYPQDVPKYFFARHRDCRCWMIYDPKDGKGKHQSIVTKDWFDN